MPDKTLEFKTKACHGGKVNKERLTAMVCANMSGTEKLPLLVLGKSEKPRCFKNVRTLPTQYKANKKAWMTAKFFKTWVREVDEKMHKQGRKIALVIDNCPAHPKKIKNLHATELVFLPRNSTSVTQPMDQGVIKNLKVHYRKQVVAKKIKAVDNNKDFSISVLDALRMMRHAWSQVTSTTIKNCYRHAGFTSTQTTDVESEDDADDDIPLNQLASILGTRVSMDDYVNIDDELQATEAISDNDILSELLEARSVDDDSDNDDTIESTIQLQHRFLLNRRLRHVTQFEHFLNP
ncbi:tigger transposable element-derived protein 4-like [Ruditapes philippinarum]|uniref:tigger transposable element-derived protein 4-like n=1 Tax=Ruditapes philippinarum TaxID=129788 RepID=UPI00295BC6B3|nr:tigger transposable element-derived protein 4-like [Ruditapes philippinarum]